MNYDMQPIVNEWHQKPSPDRSPRKEIKTEMVKTASGKRVAQYSLKKLA